MAEDPPSTRPDANNPLRGGAHHINQDNIKNDKGNVVGVNNGTLIGAQNILNFAIHTADDLTIVLERFAPKVQATSQILVDLAFKTRGISKTLTDIRELIQGEEEDALYSAKIGNDRGYGRDGDYVKVTKLPGFLKLVEACNQCSAVFKNIFEEINRPGAENLPYESIHLLELQVDEQQRSLQMNLQLFHVYVDKNYSTEMRKFIFELAISLRAVVMRLADTPAPQQAPPYTQTEALAQVTSPLLAPRPLNFPELSRLVPLYMGWKIRKANPSDFPPHSRFALSHPPSWTRTVCSPMLFSSDELFLKVLAQISRRAKRNCTLQDEYNGLRSRSQKQQVDRLIKDKNEGLPKGLEWRLAGLESVVRNTGWWRKETRRIKVILKTQWVPGVGREGGDGEADGGGGGIRLGSRNDGGGTSGLYGGGRPPPGPPEPDGGGSNIFHLQQYPERPLGGRSESAPIGAHQDGQDFRERERGNVRTHSRRSHSRRHQYPPPSPVPLSQGTRLPHRPGLIIEDASSPIPLASEHRNRHRAPPPPPNIRIPASQNYIYKPPRSRSPPPPPMYIHTPYPTPLGMLRFESHESTLRRVRSEVTPEQEELVVDSLFAEWELPSRDRREGRRGHGQRNTSYGRDWAWGRDIPQRTSYPGREYRSEPAYEYVPSRPSRTEFHQRPDFNSRSGFYSERDRYRRSYSSDPGPGSSYSSQGDYEGGESSRRRIPRYRRDSRYPTEPMRYPVPPSRPVIIQRSVPREPRNVVSYGGRDRYAEAPSPRYEERWIDERARLARPYTERTVSVFEGAHSSAPLPRGYPSEADSSVDEDIVVRREGGVRRSGHSMFPEERRRERSDRDLMLRREPLTSRRREEVRDRWSDEIEREY